MLLSTAIKIDHEWALFSEANVFQIYLELRSILKNQCFNFR